MSFQFAFFDDKDGKFDINVEDDNVLVAKSNNRISETLKISPVTPTNSGHIIDFHIVKISDNFQLKIVGESSIQTDYPDHDVVDGLYEGGLKVWECSLDLCRFIFHHSLGTSNLLHEMIIKRNNEDTGPIKVWEMGCGHGLPGLCVMHKLKDATKDFTLLFSDYNDFVTQNVTEVNIKANFEEKSLQNGKVFVASGDWIELSHWIFNNDSNSHLHQTSLESLRTDEGMFDLILASETLYTKKSSRDTADLIEKHLKPSGLALISTKRHYFGCGGGTDALKAAISDTFETKTMQIFDTGLGNIREILCVARNNPKS